VIFVPNRFGVYERITTNPLRRIYRGQEKEEGCQEEDSQEEDSQEEGYKAQEGQEEEVVPRDAFAGRLQTAGEITAEIWPPP
jgi:hypothetical protein